MIQVIQLIQVIQVIQVGESKYSPPQDCPLGGQSVGGESWYPGISTLPNLVIVLFSYHLYLYHAFRMVQTQSLFSFLISFFRTSWALSNRWRTLLTPVVNFLCPQGLHALSERLLAEEVWQWYGNNIASHFDPTTRTSCCLCFKQINVHRYHINSAFIFKRVLSSITARWWSKVSWAWAWAQLWIRLDYLVTSDTSGTSDISDTIQLHVL